MILVDANLLIYAHTPSFAQHKVARSWLDDRLNGQAAVGLPWPSLLAFVRLISNHRIFERPEPITEAWKQVEAWLQCPNVWIPQPTKRHQEVLKPIVQVLGNRSDLMPDAHLAALSVEHGLTLCSTDGDFARFQGLRWENPLKK